MSDLSQYFHGHEGFLEFEKDKVEFISGHDWRKDGDDDSYSFVLMDVRGHPVMYVSNGENGQTEWWYTDRRGSKIWVH